MRNAYVHMNMDMDMDMSRYGNATVDVPAQMVDVPAQNVSAQTVKSTCGLVDFPASSQPCCVGGRFVQVTWYPGHSG